MVTATRASSATRRSSVLGPASSRYMVRTAAAVSMTAAMTHTVVMRDPPPLLARKSCALPVCTPPMSFALERCHQQPLDLPDLAVELGHGAVGADIDHMHVDHPADLVDLQHD